MFLVSLIKNILLYTYWDLHTEKTTQTKFSLQTDVNQSNVVYLFSRIWEEWYVQSGGAYHAFSCKSIIQQVELFIDTAGLGEAKKFFAIVNSNFDHEI